MITILSIFLGIIIMCGLIWVVLYYTIGMRPMIVDLDSPKYKSMKDYDSYEDWKKDWA